MELRYSTLLGLAVLLCGALGEDMVTLSPGSEGAPLVSDREELLGDSSTIFALNDHASLEYATFKAVAGGTMVDPAGHFMRHMGDTGEMTTVSSEEDKRDTTWRIVPALCAPGTGKCPAPLQGNPRCVSLESANWAGYYLTHKAERLVVSKVEQSSWASATFCFRPGLSDRTKTSFESLDRPEHFIRHNFFHLYICDNTNKGGCGRTSLEKFREDSTFQQQEPEFLTLPGP
jgi:hypothetical protein